MKNMNTGAGVALYIDIENFVSAACALGLPLELEAVIQKLKEVGPVRLRKSFGDLKTTLEQRNLYNIVDQTRKMLHRNLIEIVDVPFLTAHKNTADLCLALDALSVAFQNPGITHFAVLSSDRDFVPLFNMLRQLGKCVIAIAVDSDKTNDMIREASDLLHYYDVLVNEQLERLSQGPAPALRIPDNAQLMAQYQALLRKIIFALEETGRRPSGALLFQLMQQQRSDFDPRLVGCQTFKQFVEKAAAAGLIRIEPDGGGDYLARIASPAPGAAAPSSAAGGAAALPPALSAPRPAGGPPASRKPDESAVQDLRRTLGEIIQVPFPSPEIRRETLREMARCYKALIAKGPFQLNELARAVYNNFVQRSLRLEEPVVFKMTLSLHLARCFTCQPNDKRQGTQYNPVIVGLAVPEDLWEREMLLNFMRQLNRLGKPLDAKLLAAAFFDQDTDENVSLIKELIEELGG